jgi:hypothetical protein
VHCFAIQIPKNGVIAIQIHPIAADIQFAVAIRIAVVFPLDPGFPAAYQTPAFWIDRGHNPDPIFGKKPLYLARIPALPAKLFCNAQAYRHPDHFIRVVLPNDDDISRTGAQFYGIYGQFFRAGKADDAVSEDIRILSAQLIQGIQQVFEKRISSIQWILIDALISARTKNQHRPDAA